ncbi:MAG: radical SAM protein, partial [Firmicutes bacterium]|nr:radical SAM protein [Bacillota bacterium]
PPQTRLGEQLGRTAEKNGADRMKAILLGTKQLMEPAQRLLQGYDTVRIVSFFELKNSAGETARIQQMYAEKSADALIMAVPNKDALKITKRLRGSEIREVFYIPHYVYGLSQPGWEEIFLPVDISKPRLSYLEFHVCDHCNLNCKACSHYANIEQEKTFAELNSYERDLHRLKELFWGIGIIRLMGGEPLLNRDLDKFVEVSRAVFPDADIRVVSNGLLIPAINRDLAAAMQRNHSGFDITLYEPTANILGKITKVLAEYQIENDISAKKKTKFYRKMTLQPSNDADISYRHCSSKKCHFLRNGQLAVCAKPILSGKLNQRYLTEYTSQAIHNIHDQDIDAWELNQQLKAPIDFCRYCAPYHEQFPWSRCDANNARLEDWLWNPPQYKLLLWNGLRLPKRLAVKFFAARPRLKTTVKKLLRRKNSDDSI